MKHFLYCGARYAEKLPDMNALYDFAAGWEIHFFEPNPFINSRHATSAAKRFGARCRFHSAAVWTDDGSVSLRLQFCDRKNGRGNAVRDLASRNKFLRGGEEVVIPSIDLSRFVAELDSEAIVLRMDIEGAEFQVLRKMVAENTLAKVKELHIEWHERHLADENASTVTELKATIERFGVAVHELR